jgi:hypothetical protein
VPPIATCDNNIDLEINHRISMENKCYYGIQNLLRSKLLIIDSKCKIYKTFIKPVVLYGSENWILTKLNEDN